MNTKYTIDRKGFFGQMAVILLLLSAVLKGVAAILSRAMLRGDLFATVEFLLPAVACLFYALAIILLGKKGFFLSVLPFIGGVLAFIMRLFSYDNLAQELFPLRHAFLSVLIYLIILTVYTATVSGGVRTKWLLPPLFLLMLVYHVGMEIYPVIASNLRVEASQIIAEVSIFSLLLGLLSASFGITGEKYREKPPVPSIWSKTPEDKENKEGKEKDTLTGKEAVAESKTAEVKEEPEVIVAEDVPELTEEEAPEAEVPVQTEPGDNEESAKE